MFEKEDDGFEQLISEYMAAYDVSRDEAIAMIDKDYDINDELDDDMNDDWASGRGFADGGFRHFDDDDHDYNNGIRHFDDDDDF